MSAFREVAVSMALACVACSAHPADNSSDAIPLTLRAIGDSVWEASYGPVGEETRFRIHPHLKAFPDTTPFAFTSWTLLPAGESHPKSLLAALAKLHGAADTVSVPPRADSLHLNVALLGLNTARSRDGAFGANNTGTWIPAKLFLGDGEGEIYLNLNLTEGKGEFALKDEEYGPIVLRELARVLSGSARQSPGER